MENSFGAKQKLLSKSRCSEVLFFQRGNEEDKDKQLVLRPPLETPAIYSGPRNFSSPVYEEVLMTVNTVRQQEGV